MNRCWRFLIVSCIPSLAVVCRHATAPETLAGCYSFKWASKAPPFRGDLRPDSMLLTAVPVERSDSAPPQWVLASASIRSHAPVEFTHGGFPVNGWQWYTYFPVRSWKMIGRDSVELTMKNSVWRMRLRARVGAGTLAGIGVLAPAFPRTGDESRQSRFTASHFTCPQR
jgi:hypothetical protein